MFILKMVCYNHTLSNQIVGATPTEDKLGLAHLIGF